MRVLWQGHKNTVYTLTPTAGANELDYKNFKPNKQSNKSVSKPHSSKGVFAVVHGQVLHLHAIFIPTAPRKDNRFEAQNDI